MNKTNVLTEQLISHLGLSGDPFAEDVFFAGAQRQHNIETMRHMSSFGDMVLLVTGDRGAGKSTLLRQFAIEAEELNVLIVSSAGKGDSHKNIPTIKMLEQKVGLKTVSGETLQQTFGRILNALQKKFEEDKTRSVIVIDDAETLPKKELHFYLSSFKAFNESSGVIGILAGLPVLLQKARLESNDHEEEWLHQIQLKPLGVSDCLEYLQIRLERVGFSQNLDLSDVQLAHLADVGKGLPGRINRLFSSVLLEPGSLKVGVNSSRANLKRVLLGLAILLGLSFVFVAYQYGMFEPRNTEVSVVKDSGETLTRGDADSDSLAGFTNGELDNRELDSDSTVVPEGSGDKSDEQFAEAEKQARIAMLDRAISDTMTQEPEEGGRESNAPNANGLTESAFAEVQALTNTEQSELPINEAEGSVESQLSEQAKREPSPAVESVPAAPSESQSNVLNSESEKLLSERVEVLADKPFFRTKSWLKSLSGESYTAQVLGSHNEQTAVKFAIKLKSQLAQDKTNSQNSVEVYYLKTLYKQKDWYVVIYGVFPDKSAASQALKSAPEVVRKQKPWLRRVDAILKSYPK